MPLPPPVDREPIHTRRIECTGYRRTDGLWDVEGHLVDTKSYEFVTDSRGKVAPGVAIHNMWIRLTVDEDLTVHDVVASTDASPYQICPQAADRMGVLKGLKIGRGWRSEIQKRLGGAAGCTHLVEMLGPVATTAYQTLVFVRLNRPEVLTPEGIPAKIDSCYAYGSDREVVRERWPALFTGPS